MQEDLYLKEGLKGQNSRDVEFTGKIFSANLPVKFT